MNLHVIPLVTNFSPLSEKARRIPVVTSFLEDINLVSIVGNFLISPVTLILYKGVSTSFPSSLCTASDITEMDIVASKSPVRIYLSNFLLAMV